MKFKDDRQIIRLETSQIIDLKKYEEKYFSFKNLCEIFNVSVAEGDSRNNQLKQFQEYMVLTKEKSKYFVEEVYDPKTRIIMSGSQFRSKEQIKFESYIAEELLNLCCLKPLCVTNAELLKAAHYIDNYYEKIEPSEYHKLINSAKRRLNKMIDRGIVCWSIGFCLYVKSSNKVRYINQYDPDFDYIAHLYELTIPDGFKQTDIFELPYCTDITKIDDSILKNVACPYYKIKRVNIIQALIDDFNLQRFII